MPEGQAAAEELVQQVQSRVAKTDVVIAVGAANKDTAALAESVGQTLQDRRLLPTSRSWWARRASCDWHWMR